MEGRNGSNGFFEILSDYTNPNSDRANCDNKE